MRYLAIAIMASLLTSCLYIGRQNYKLYGIGAPFIFVGIKVPR